MTAEAKTPHFQVRQGKLRMSGIFEVEHPLIKHHLSRLRDKSTPPAAVGMNSVESRLAELPDFLSPLRDAASRYVRYSSVVDKDGVVSIGHRPWVAPENYLFFLYPGISTEMIERYSATFEIEIPQSYTTFLNAMCGAFCFGMSLFGIPRSMLADPPLLDRSSLQCHNLASAVRKWSREFRGAAGLFHFGYRHFSYEENIGYFIDRSGRYLSVRKQGEIVATWNNFTEFLADELCTSEKLAEELDPPQWPD